LIITAAALIGYGLAYQRVKSRGEDPDHLTNIFIYGLISGLIGARLFYVLFNLPDYLPRPSDMIAIWQGGLSIHGGLTGAIIAGAIYTRRYNINFWHWADMIVPSIILGQAIGRWGNYVNQEAFGTPTNLPWAIYIEPAKRPLEYIAAEYFHPTFLYESIWNLLGFGLLIYMAKRQQLNPLKWPAGSLLLIYGIYYSVGRTAIEALRADALMLGPVIAAQLGGAVIIAVCAALLVSRRRAAESTFGATVKPFKKPAVKNKKKPSGKKAGSGSGK
jgi:phosphatidylglycerol---prolipoprotein diacylglyceryl transferase